MTGRKPRQEAEVAGESLNFDFLPRGFIQRNKNLAQSMSTPSLERVQTQVTRHVSSTLEEWRGNSKTFVDSVQSLASQGFPSLSIEAGPGPMSTKSKSSFGARNVAPLKNGQSGGGDGVSRPQRRNRRNSADSLNDARRQRQSPPSGSPKTPDSNSSSLILSPQSVVPTMRRVMSDTSIENFLKDAKERVVTATEWSNQQNTGLGSKQNSLENLLSIPSPLSNQSVESLRKTGTMVHSRSAQALASTVSAEALTLVVVTSAWERRHRRLLRFAVDKCCCGGAVGCRGVGLVQLL